MHPPLDVKFVWRSSKTTNRLDLVICTYGNPSLLRFYIFACILHCYDLRFSIENTFFSNLQRLRGRSRRGVQRNFLQRGVQPLTRGNLNLQNREGPDPPRSAPPPNAAHTLPLKLSPSAGKRGYRMQPFRISSVTRHVWHSVTNIIFAAEIPPLVCLIKLHFCDSSGCTGLSSS
jgi:hypothetical protein